MPDSSDDEGDIERDIVGGFVFRSAFSGVLSELLVVVSRCPSTETPGNNNWKLYPVDDLREKPSRRRVYCSLRRWECTKGE